MWPWEHLAFGYVVLSIICRVRGYSPGGWSVAAVALGTQFPDIVDKPLSWQFGVLPAARSLAHSAVIAVPVVVVVWFVATARGHRAVGSGFGVGYLTHLVGDAVPWALDGYYSGLRFLAWPLLSAPQPKTANAVDRFLEVVASPGLYFSMFPYRALVFFAIVAVWVDDGSPGIADVVRYCYRGLVTPEGE